MKYSTMIILTILGFIFGYKAYDFMTVDIYVIRHGETNKNRKDKFIYGDLDLPLNEKGRKNIQDIAKELSIKNQNLYTSPQKRAVETAKVIAETTQSQVTLDDRLKERDQEKHGRETKESQLKRVMNFLHENLNFKTENLWLVTHGGVIGSLLGQAGVHKRLPIKNGSIFVFSYNKLTKKLSFKNIRKV
tara:strand:- start:10489 stop:11055 length:567 start_codon:yes stop_codon:yes gene_type:complete